jgi:hypothetical protein
MFNMIKTLRNLGLAFILSLAACGKKETPRTSVLVERGSVCETLAKYPNGSYVAEVFPNLSYGPFSNYSEFPIAVYEDTNGDGLVDKIAFEDPEAFHEADIPQHGVPRPSYAYGRRVKEGASPVKRIERSADYNSFKRRFDDADYTLRELTAELNAPKRED